jgi:ABC-type Zn uptake system ZnuABC Zn-binding protein ZnuA
MYFLEYFFQKLPAKVLFITLKTNFLATFNSKMMKKMKKLVFLGLFATFCTGSRANPKIVATTSMIADIAQNIAGNRLKIDCILPIGSDPHLHEPTPRDAQMVGEANLVLVNGLTLEGWMKELIENSGTKARIVTCTEGIQAIVSEQFHGSADPHAWMQAANGIIYAQNICKALSVLNPAESSVYEDNLKKYVQQLTDLDQFIKITIASIPENRRVLVTSHDAFHYYGARYGLRLEAVLGTSTDADVQTSDMVRLAKVLATTGVPALFVESTINPKLLQQIAADNHVEVGGKLFADSLGDSVAATYIDLLRHNTTVIAAALKKDKLLTTNDLHAVQLPKGAFSICLTLFLLTVSGTFYRLSRV